MPGSQLKRLKASLREQGVIGPQQSKKQRRKAAQNGKVNTNKRAAALESIRDEFNPFDFKHNARGPKFQVTSNRPAQGDAAKGITGRPGDAQAMGGERVCIMMANKQACAEFNMCMTDNDSVAAANSPR